MTADNSFKFAVAGNQAGGNLRSLALGAGWNGIGKVVATIATGYYCAASGYGGVGLTVNGSFPNGVALIISFGAYIYGGAGAGAPDTGSSANIAGSAGGVALAVSVPIFVTNNGTIAGGGGGGGSGGNNAGVPSGFNSGGPGGNGSYNGIASTAGGAGWSGGGGGNGGNGGAMGVAGSAGIGAYWLGGAGGAAGNSVTGNSNITWLATGTRTGPIS